MSTEPRSSRATACRRRVVEVVDIEWAVQLVVTDAPEPVSSDLVVGTVVVGSGVFSKSHHKLACPPEEPWPPSPREVPAKPASSNEVTSTSSGNSTRCTSSWAIRSPRCTMMGCSGSRLIKCHLDLAAIARVDRAGAVDDRKSHARSQTRPRMHQPHHPVREWPPRSPSARGRDGRAVVRRRPR